MNKMGQMHAFLLTPLHIDSITRNSNGNVVLQGQTVPNGSVRIEASSDLGTGFSLAETIVADETGAFSWEDLQTTNFTQRFYRAGLPVAAPQMNVSAVKNPATTARKQDGNAFSRRRAKTSALR